MSEPDDDDYEMPRYSEDAAHAHDTDLENHQLMFRMPSNAVVNVTTHCSAEDAAMLRDPMLVFARLCGAEMAGPLATLVKDWPVMRAQLLGLIDNANKETPFLVRHEVQIVLPSGTVITIDAKLHGDLDDRPMLRDPALVFAFLCGAKVDERAWARVGDWPALRAALRGLIDDSERMSWGVSS
jgi:hypothetical protein